MALRGRSFRRPLPRLALFAALLVLALPRFASASEPLDLFDKERAAYQHCRNDIVVWLDVPHQTYFFRGQRGYAGSKNGGYTCWGDAKRSHNRPAAGGPLKPKRG